MKKTDAPFTQTHVVIWLSMWLFWYRSVSIIIICACEWRVFFLKKRLCTSWTIRPIYNCCCRQRYVLSSAVFDRETLLLFMFFLVYLNTQFHIPFMNSTSSTDLLFFFFNLAHRLLSPLSIYNFILFKFPFKSSVKPSSLCTIYILHMHTHPLTYTNINGKNFRC